MRTVHQFPSVRFPSSRTMCPLLMRLGALVVVLLLVASADAANQTNTVTPIEPAGQLPYRISVREYEWSAADLPTLHSYAAAEYDGKWILLAGRTNGIHGFENNVLANFPEEFQNSEVWVIDPIAKQSWRRSLEDASAGLTADQVYSLTPTNNQFYQSGSRLYMTGGYGIQPDGGFGTFDTLSAVDLPGITDWVVNGSGAAADNIRQINGSSFQVTGGAMYQIGTKTHVIFGQNFQGGYRPGKVGTYTKQVRSFEIVDDGVNLSIQNESATTPEDAFRRRDLNIAPVIRSGTGGTLNEELVVLSGVFTDTFGAWTVPVEIDGNGIPNQVDLGNDPLNANDELDNDPNVFKQGFNGYHSAKMGLFSESTGEMSTILFGGISLQYLNESTGQVETDQDLPFVNDITSLVIDSNGQYGQHHLGFFPELFDLDNNRLRFGANAEFFLADGIDSYNNGVVKLDQIVGETVLGHIFGGIVTNGPHTRQGADSAGSNRIFEVVLVPVPEPATWVLFGLAAVGLGVYRKRCPLRRGGRV